MNARVDADRRLLWAYQHLLSHALTAWSRDELHRHAPAVAEQVRGYLRDLVVWHTVVETISERRYEGYDVLLPGPCKELDDLKAQAEQKLTRFNDHLELVVWKRQQSGRRTPRLPKPIEWGTLREARAETVASQFGLLVDVARAEAC